MIIEFKEIQFEVSQYFPVLMEEILEAESQLGISFPQDYRDFVTTLGYGNTNFSLGIIPPKFIGEFTEETRELFREYWFWNDSPDILTKERALECFSCFNSAGGDDILFHPDSPNRWFILPHEMEYVDVVNSFQELVAYYHYEIDNENDDEDEIDDIEGQTISRLVFNGWDLVDYLAILGVGIFGYIEAGGLRDDFERSTDRSLLSNALNALTEDSADITQVPKCCVAVAAAEIVAALNGKGSKDAYTYYPESRDWLERQAPPDPNLIAKARQAIDLILTDSELKDMWAQRPDDYPQWLAVMHDLKNRLQD